MNFVYIVPAFSFEITPSKSVITFIEDQSLIGADWREYMYWKLSDTSVDKYSFKLGLTEKQDWMGLYSGIFIIVRYLRKKMMMVNENEARQRFWGFFLVNL